LGQVADYLASEVLVPCLRQLCEVYGAQLSFELHPVSHDLHEAALSDPR